MPQEIIDSDRAYLPVASGRERLGATFQLANPFVPGTHVNFLVGDEIAPGEETSRIASRVLAHENSLSLVGTDVNLVTR